jgi:hypothetical protein
LVWCVRRGMIPDLANYEFAVLPIKLQTPCRSIYGCQPFRVGNTRQARIRYYSMLLSAVQDGK